MLIYPEGMLAISSQHRQEMIEEAQRWRLLRRARRTRRDRHIAPDSRINSTDNGSGADAQADAASRRGHIAGWVAAGGRGRVEIPPNPSTRNDLGRRPLRSAR